MKVFIFLSVAVACVLAKPTTTVFTGVPVAYAAAPVAVSSQFHAQDELGQYNYGYTSGLSSKVESKSLDGVTRGGYAYVDGYGKVQNVQYTADAVNGFRVAATNLPVAPVVAARFAEVEHPKPVVDTPEVAAAKIQHMAAVSEAKARNAAAEVEVVAPVVAAPTVPLAPFTHIAPVATPAVATVKYASPAAFSYGYTATAPFAPVVVAKSGDATEKKTEFSYGYTHFAPYASGYTFGAAPVAYSAGPVTYTAPVAYPHGYAYTVPSYYNYNFVPKVEEVKA